jgi:hypothetical protein
VELSILMKLRIAVAFAVGTILIGFLAWPLVAPAEPAGVVSFITGNISSLDSIILLALAFLCGFIAYFFCWPFGREVAILAAPAGLALWSIRSGNMGTLIQLNPTLAQRQQIFTAIKWEPILWLIIILAGFAGVLLAQKLKPAPKTINTPHETKKTSRSYLNSLIAIVTSGIIAQVCIGILAQDVRVPDNKLASVVAQPAIGQIIFALLVAFGLAAFIAKKFLDANYIWPIISSGFVAGLTITFYVDPIILEYLTEHHPPIFFSNGLLAILPIQVVTFATLGSIIGYWLAIRYEYWRKHEIAY